MDIMTAVADTLQQRGVQVKAKLLLGERVHRFSMPSDLQRRKANQEELLSWLEHRPKKMVPKAADELKNIFGKASDTFELSMLDTFKKAIEGVDGDTLLKDVPEITAIAPVKDADINTRQFGRILQAAFEERKNRVKSLQSILRISDDDLSVKNLKKYLTNVAKEISNKSNYYDIARREINDEMQIPRITHKDLAFKFEHDLPTEASSMIRQYQEFYFKQYKKVLTIGDAIEVLFPGVKHKIEIHETDPIRRSPEVSDIRENLIHLLDRLTGHGWESHYTLSVVRSMKEVVLVGFYMNEEALLKKGMPVYKKVLPKIEEVGLQGERFMGRRHREYDPDAI